MVLDSSALIAVVFREKEHRQLEERMADAGSISIGAPTLFESAMVSIGRFGAEGEELLAQFLEDLDVETRAFDERHWHTATSAFDRYGKGRHPAALNFGDCMSYATARVADESLLFTGNDFAKTDIPPA
jgi:ribonuclease VapC